ncbi:MAG: radical SAM protein [Bacteroidales bacterium]|nr:radical SAM protein [Bacteroidales bacterium]
MTKAKIFAIDGLRIESDGEGIRSLVCFAGCPLKCKYCINKKMMKGNDMKEYTPLDLLVELMKYDAYFKGSDGGVTFGGGEPALQSEFIKEFKSICPPDWHIDIETSLNVPRGHVETLADIIGVWHVDIKDMNPEIYKKYTKSNNRLVLENLRYLIDRGLADRIHVRVPSIPEYNRESDVEKSCQILTEMGLSKIEMFPYVMLDKWGDRVQEGCPYFGDDDLLGDLDPGNTKGFVG